MRSTKAVRIKRTLMALLLMFVLSFTAVYADDDDRTENPSVDTAQTEATEENTDDPPETPEIEEPEPEPAASIIKLGKYYYYQEPDGTIRKKAGFVTVDDKIYYVRKGGKIRTNATFRVNKKYYRAGRSGVIKTGVYKWNSHYYYSYAKGQWKRKAGFVTWNGNRYYVQKGGRIITNDGFAVKNTVYVADRKGLVTKVVLSEEDDNNVIEIARKQVGIMTGKKYWVWYYRTRFRDTDRTPWCGAFVAWCYNEAGLYKKISVAKKYGPLGYVPSYSRYADKYKKWIKKKDARPGDIIIFGRNWHVGLVEGIYGNYIVTIEGNAGPTAAYGCGKPGAVVRKIYKLNSKKIKGVICVLRH